MEQHKACTCRGKHQEYIFVLKSNGLTREIEQLMNAPTVACFTCGVDANVCTSLPLLTRSGFKAVWPTGKQT